MKRDAAQLRDKIASHTARVGIVGLGYVGLPLATEFARHGFRVTGIDVDSEKVAAINRGDSYVGDVPAAEVAPLVKQGLLRATKDYRQLARLDTVNICVPTPLRKTKDPDLSYILAAVEQIQKHLRPGMLVILESTTYPGTTEEFILPRLAETGLQVGRDFFLCFSPERVDPGNRQYTTRNIPKVVGGITPACVEMGALFYRQAMESVVPVSSTKVAEMVKLLENTFRSINIGLANEMALLCDHMKIDVWEVIEAAATKPFGFMPFYPGPGLGGHCIPVDPFYLSWKAKMDGAEARFIELAGQINAAMPRFVVNKVQAVLNQSGKAVRNSRIHLLGVAYKKDTGDVRESPALDVLALLTQQGARMTYSDPLVPHLSLDGLELQAQPVLPSCRQADCVVLLTDHTSFDYAAIARCSRRIVDTRNAFRAYRMDKIARL
ncbi:MAG: UDP-N-acetyl-D-glucosamine dehydrogenase [Acidobacteria bacterium RIFCSPLOWO2_02_FULL_61_28]|nr:MAG: UDP-N-acetyl-D-glucosamine dehydrogenase [Acidobacteria bacterium RIFCSPLOWO2_02_FULL_61_28]